MLLTSSISFGCLLGTALGDALGLPAEGLSPAKQHRYFGEITAMRLIGGRGMVSDDTEHALFTAQAIVASAGEPRAFQYELARQLRRWILAIPPGVGLATLRAGWKVALGVSPEKSGVFSAGNGPAMRAPILGACFGSEPEKLRVLNRISSRITHTDPKAEVGALTVAAAVWCAINHKSNAEFLPLLETFLIGLEAREEMLQLAGQALESAKTHQDGAEFCAAMGWKEGPSGYIFHTVPAVLQVWLRNRSNFRAGVMEMISLGGDADSTGAILGGILGAEVGAENLPDDWKRQLWEWPRGAIWIERLAETLVQTLKTGQGAAPLSVPLGAAPLRNVVQTAIILAHGFRRLMPQ
jgi:ADP-ribosylglycohydrolase